MKKYERDLQKVLSKVNEGFTRIFEGVDGLTGSDLRFLEAKGLVELENAGDGEVFAQPTAKGLTYFSDKKDLADQQSDQMSAEKAKKKADRRFQLFNTLVGAVVGALLMFLLDHFREVLVFFQALRRILCRLARDRLLFHAGSFLFLLRVIPCENKLSQSLEIVNRYSLTFENCCTMHK